MLTDGRKLFRMLRQMVQEKVPAYLVEVVLLGLLEECCEECRRKVTAARQEARQKRLLRPLMDAWYPSHHQKWSLERAHHLRRELLRPRYWEARFDRVENARTEYGSPALVALLLADAQDHLQDDPAEAERYARLAELAACRGQAALTAGCRHLATACVANTLRATGRLREAARHFATARDVDPPHSHWIRGEILSLQGSLLKDQRRLQAARTCLERALTAFEKAADDTAAARVKLNLGAVEKHRGNLEEALHWTRSALPDLDPHEDPRLHLWAHHNLALYHCEAGDPATARRLMQLLKPLYQRYQDTRDAIRVRWLEALIARGDNDPEQAESLLRDVVDDFLREKQPLYAALAALDLAVVLLDEGRHRELQQVATTLATLFREEELDPEAQTAVYLFRTTAEEQRVTRHLLMELRDHLEAARAGIRVRSSIRA